MAATENMGHKDLCALGPGFSLREVQRAIAAVARVEADDDCLGHEVSPFRVGALLRCMKSLAANASELVSYFLDSGKISENNTE